MWVSFFLVAVVIGILLYVPGYLLAKCFYFKSCTSFAIAPAFSIFLYVLLGIAYGAVGEPVAWWSIVVPAFALPMVAMLVSSFVSRKRFIAKAAEQVVEWKVVLLYVAVGIFIVGIYFVKDLNGAGSFAQLYDNASHLNGIRSMVENGNYSILLYGLYSAEEVGSGIAPTEVSGSFYPAAWHLVTALGSAITNAEATVSENASLAVFMGVLFPASVSLLMSRIFCENQIIIIGSLVTLGFTAFPWGFLTFGPLYSNLAAFCLVPLSICCISSVFSSAVSAKRRFAWLFVFAISCVTLASLQPNAVFAVVVLGTPFCAAEFFFLLEKRGIRKRTAAALCGISVVALIAVWALAWSSPLFEGVVAYPWPAFESKQQALFGILSLSLRSFTPQWLLGALVLIGFVWTVVKKKYRYLAISYLISSAIFIVCASSDGVLRSILAGFWYNDAYRIAALVGLSSIPLASIGGFFVLTLVTGAVRNLRMPSAFAPIGCMALFVLGAISVFSPVGLIQGEDCEEAAFGVVNDKLNWISSPDTRRYTVEEADFVRRAMALTKDDPGGIVNVPYDGSVFSYGADGANVMFRSYATAGEYFEKSESVLVREGLNLIADNMDVREAAHELGAKYVLLLDCEGMGSVISSLDDDMAASDCYEYRGIVAINEQTPGFDLIASEEDMRLYRIDC